jgi:hypothetical protein
MNLFAGALLLSLSTAASAVTFTSSPGAPDPGPAAGQTLVVTFDAAAAPGYSWTGGLQTAIGSVPSVYAAPAGDNTVFGYVTSAVNPNNATLDTPNLKSISFYWGSIDRYNKVEILDGAGNVLHTVEGGDFSAADGNQLVPGTNRRVFFTAAPGTPISGLRLTSTGVAFEFDDFAATAVPEPATWAMLIAGFGLVGFASRRRRALAVASA